MQGWYILDPVRGFTLAPCASLAVRDKQKCWLTLELLVSCPFQTFAVLQWPWATHSGASEWATEENEERKWERETPPACLSTDNLSTPPQVPRLMVHVACTHTHICYIEHIHTLLTSRLPLQHSWVSDREVAGGEHAYLPPLLFLFKLHPSHPTHHFPSLPFTSCLPSHILSFISFITFLCLAVRPSCAFPRSLFVPFSPQFIMSFICLCLNCLG